jgi:hypothetical protein
MHAGLLLQGTGLGLNPTQGPLVLIQLAQALAAFLPVAPLIPSMAKPSLGQATIGATMGAGEDAVAAARLAAREARRTALQQPLYTTLMDLFESVLAGAGGPARPIDDDRRLGQALVAALGIDMHRAALPGTGGLSTRSWSAP